MFNAVTMAPRKERARGERKWNSKDTEKVRERALRGRCTEKKDEF